MKQNFAVSVRFRGREAASLTVNFAAIFETKRSAIGSCTEARNTYVSSFVKDRDAPPAFSLRVPRA